MPLPGELPMLADSTCQHGALADGSWDIDIVDSGPSCRQDLPEGMIPEREDPPAVESYPRSAVCETGKPLTGSCKLLGPRGQPLASSWIIVELYPLTFDGNQGILVQLSHEVMTCDWETGSDNFSCSTDDLAPGYYVLYLVFEGLPWQKSSASRSSLNRRLPPRRRARASRNVIGWRVYSPHGHRSHAFGDCRSLQLQILFAGSRFKGCDPARARCRLPSALRGQSTALAHGRDRRSGAESEDSTSL